MGITPGEAEFIRPLGGVRMPKNPFLGIFSPGGKLVAFTDDVNLFKEVAPRIADALPEAADKASGILLDARRKAIKSLVGKIEG